MLLKRALSLLSNTILLQIIVVFALASCERNTPPASNENIIQLNQPNAIINPFTGDSVQPIQTTTGEIINTSEPLQRSKKAIEQNSLPEKTLLNPPVFQGMLNGKVEHSEAISAEVLQIGSAQINPDIPPIVLKYDTSHAEVVNKNLVSSSVVDNKTPFRIRSFSKETGLLDDYTTAPVQDDNGVLWYSTGAILSFDGVEIKEYHSSYGLFGTQTELYRDNTGKLWFSSGFYGHLNSFNGKEVKSAEIGRHEIIGQTVNDQLLILLDSSIYILEHDTLHFLLSAHWIKKGKTKCIQDGQGGYWIAGKNGIFGHLKNELLLTYQIQNNRSRIYSMAIDTSETLWLGLKDGLYSFKDNELIYHSNDSELSTAPVLDLFCDDQNRLWIAYNNAGIDILDDHKILHLNIDLFFPNTSRRIWQDKDSQIWLATPDRGFFVLDKGMLRSYFPSTENKGIRFKDLEVDEYGRFWALSDEGLYIIDPQSKEVFRQEDLSERFKFNRESTLLSRNDETWFTAFDLNGNSILGRIQGDSLEIYGSEQGFDFRASDIEMDKHGTLWIGGFHGLRSFDGISFYNELPDIRGSVNSLSLDEQGNVLIAHNYLSIMQYADTTWNLTTRREGFWQMPWKISVVDSNSMIVGTWNKGCAFIQDSSYFLIKAKHGLGNDHVCNVATSTNGLSWVMTWSGLSSFKASDVAAYMRGENHDFTVDQFSKLDGLRSNGFENHHQLLEHDNKIWFANQDALISIGMEDYEKKNQANLIVTDVLINGKDINYMRVSEHDGIAFEVSKTVNQKPQSLKLDYSHNHIDIYFALVDHTEQHKTKYSYRIIEFNDQWSTPSPERHADFKNLPEGQYTFEVRAMGSGHSWTEPSTFTFKVLPPWWRTVWANIIYVLSALAFLFSIVKWRTRKLKQRQKELEVEVEKATMEISEQKKNLENTHKEITDSIQYAQRIQSAILPPQKLVKEYLSNSFILYKPKDVVAGDFYWLEHFDSKIHFAACDCTGHGVPGAMVSVICNNGLNRSIREYGITEPGKILDKTREIVIQEFEKSEEEVQDGMDVALCSLDGNQLKYAGAHNPLWIIRKGATEVEEIKANKQPIGKYADLQPFTTHTIELNPGDSIYLFSDGYVDQFGGEKGKKFKSLNFKRLLVSLQHLDMEAQRTAIDNAFEKWKGELEQIDDVCVIGVRI